MVHTKTFGLKLLGRIYFCISFAIDKRKKNNFAVELLSEHNHSVKIKLLLSSLIDIAMLRIVVVVVFVY